MLPEEIQKLLEFIAREVAAEPLSGLMPYGPVWTVNALTLLDEIGNIWGLAPEAIGAVVNPIREKLEAERGR